MIIKTIVAIKKFKIIIEAKFFLKRNKIKIEKIKSNSIGRASKLTTINVIKNRTRYRNNFFT